MTEAIQNQEKYYDLVWQLLDVAEKLPVDFLDQMQRLIDAGADVNAAFDDDGGSTYALAYIIKEINMHGKCDIDNDDSSWSEEQIEQYVHPADSLYKIVQLFIKNGFDATKGDGRQGALCLANLSWAFCAWNRYLIDTAILLIDVGADPGKPIRIHFDDSWDETPKGEIGTRCITEMQLSPSEYSSNLFETIFQIMKAKVEERDYRAIRSQIHAHGQSISRVLLVAPNEGDVCRTENHQRPNFYRIKYEDLCGIIFECGNHPIFINHYGMVYEDANPLNCPAICKVDVTQDFYTWLGKPIKKISNVFDSNVDFAVKFEFDDAEPLYMVQCDKPKNREKQAFTTYCQVKGDETFNESYAFSE